MPRHLKKLFQSLGALFAVLLIVIGFLFTQPEGQSAGAGKLQVTVLDVGQGDSILIETPKYQNILIDGGPDETILGKLGKHLGSGEGIDLMVLTHPHADHAAGLIKALERYQVKQFLGTGVVHTTMTYQTLLQTIRDKQIPFTTAQYGKVFDLGEGIELAVLYPFQDYSGKELKDLGELQDGLNDTSVVLKLTYGSTTFLFMGDASQGIERELVTAFHEVLKSDVLKVGHQGSNTASSNEFLQIVRPTYALISVGAGNTYGHPHAAALEHLEAIHTEIIRTDEVGDIEIVSDGAEVSHIE